jgi:HSP20 family protein
MEKSRKTHVTIFGAAHGQYAYELRVQYPSASHMEGWTPAVNVFGCQGQIVVCVELAGVEKRSIEVNVQPHRLTVRGYREAPEPADCDGPLMQVLALEIDQGFFEREITLPVEVDPKGVRAEHRNGLLWIHLPLRQQKLSLKAE